MVEKFTFADLFAGIGGMRLAIEQAGGRCVLTNEIDENALRTYFLNFPPISQHAIVRDINNLRRNDFEKFPNGIDFISAGFPCQPYSIAGLRKGLSDDRGGQIFSSLLRVIGEAEPRAFLLENVKGLVSHDSGKTFRYIEDQLVSMGYFIRTQTLNSMTHADVPQNRERVFIVGFREESAAKAFIFPNPIKLKKSVADCLQRPDQVEDNFYYDARYPMYSEIEKNINEEGIIYQWRRQYVRANKSGVCPTLTANMGSGGHNVPLVRDRRGIRKLTPRETANFQGFPSDFLLPPLASSHLYHQFGNSVTVPLIRRITENLVRFL